MPIGQDRAAIEKDHVHVVDDRAGRLPAERHAAIEAEQAERAILVTVYEKRCGRRFQG
jgi:hypothetical protein